MFEQYIRDLAVFGVNSIELLPPHTDDLLDSPLFTLPPQQMMVEVSHIADGYGPDVWMWYPAMESNYRDPNVVDKSFEAWEKVFFSAASRCGLCARRRSGSHGAERFVCIAGETEAEPAAISPRAQIWVSPQGFDAEWMSEFLRIVRQEHTQAWLDGIVYGPMCRLSEAELRQALPPSYPIRCYPDITHSLQCQYPVPE